MNIASRNQFTDKIGHNCSPAAAKIPDTRPLAVLFERCAAVPLGTAESRPETERTSHDTLDCKARPELPTPCSGLKTSPPHACALFFLPVIISAQRPWHHLACYNPMVRIRPGLNNRQSVRPQDLHICSPAPDPLHECASISAGGRRNGKRS